LFGKLTAFFLDLIVANREQDSLQNLFKIIILLLYEVVGNSECGLQS